MRRLLVIVVPIVLVLASCSTSSDPTATYTGGACAYDGPSEFEVNSTVTFVVTNDSDTESVGFTVWKFPEGTTPEQVYDDGIFAVVSRNPGAIGEKFPPTALGAEYDLTVTFSESGQHGINCFEFGGPATEADHVTMFTVNG
ncbi:MAG: hypothetical protein DRJ28_02500 [Actinobacteria bacterium]|nr:MAG: hypothetical protein DRJ28_02500 [Actinomycetota bacterium]